MYDEFEWFANIFGIRKLKMDKTFSIHMNVGISAIIIFRDNSSQSKYYTFHHQIMMILTKANIVKKSFGYVDYLKSMVY